MDMSPTVRLRTLLSAYNSYFKLIVDCSKKMQGTLPFPPSDIAQVRAIREIAQFFTAPTESAQFKKRPNYQWKSLTALVAFSALFCFTSEIRANEGDGSKVFSSPKSRLEGNEPTYFVWVPQHDINTGFSNRYYIADHLEFMLSIRYALVNHEFNNVSTRLFFLYKGQYDFFAGTRPSSPVVSRQQNPGLAVQHTFANALGILKSIKYGYYHESDGQTFDEEEYRKLKLVNPNPGVPYDFISRGWDYWGVELRLKFGDHFEIYENPRIFTGKQAVWSTDKEDRIFWDSSNKSKITQYDGLTTISNFYSSVTILDYTIPYRISFLHRIGYEYPYHQSFKLQCRGMFHNFPLTIFYFSGYGENLSTYHLKSEYIGIGMELW